MLAQKDLTEEIQVQTSTLVVGGGWTGIKAASELASAGYSVVLIDRDANIGGQTSSGHLTASAREELSSLLDTVKKHERVEMLDTTSLVSLTGVPGSFLARLKRNGVVLERDVGAVVVALEAENASMIESYGLHPSEKVLSQSQIEEVLTSSEEKDLLLSDPPKDIVFLVGLRQEGNPVVMEKAIQSAVEIQDSGKAQTMILVGNVKLAHDGLEALYKQSREKGVLYFKLREPPRISQNGSGLRLDFFDGVLRDEVVLAPDVVVVAEAIRPSQQFYDLEQVLRIETDHDNFFQPDNVHCLPVQSNREGIYVIGSARLPSDLAQSWADAHNAALAVRNFLGEGKKSVPKEKAKIHRGKCTICLTCFRVCPHGAVYWDNRAVISPLACQGCGICASECPMDAIQLVEYTDDQMEAQIFAATEQQVDTPRIIAFLCQNSAYEAAEMARLFGDAPPQGLQVIKVPCAGKVDVDYILTAFQAGADGVLVLACHKDNCKSLRGNTFADWRVEDTRRMLEEVGLEKERLQFATLASNMPVEFVRIIREVEQELETLGPNRIKKQVAA
jgi:heterodisulfide reductase subunit A-like polyferredoxin/coenzyme F420-reducing hydrogenase delta subunit